MTQLSPVDDPHVRAGPQVLVVSTLSTASNNAARRAALIASEKGWPLRVLHVEREPKRIPAAQAAVEKMCGQLRDRLGIAPDAEMSSGDLLKQVLRHAQSSSLLVIGSAQEDALKERLDGVGVDRFVRLSRIPTLVVKRRVDAAFAQGAPDTDGRYRRVLVCADLEPATPAAVAAANDIAPAGRVEAFHAVSSRARHQRPGANDAETSAVLAQARAALAQLLDSSGTRVDAASAGFGDPGEAILAKQRALGADLIVIGKRQRGLLADFFLGDVTRRVLACSSADVLVLPRLPP